MENPVQPKTEIPFEVLEQLDVRVGTILEVTDIPDSKKVSFVESRSGLCNQERCSWHETRT